MPAQHSSQHPICVLTGQELRRPITFHPASKRPIIGGMGRVLIYLGILLIALGLAVIGLGRMGVPLGRLPGDIAYRGKNVSVFAPIGTSILLSIVLSVLLYVIGRFWR
jgi:DUF2905 family protein